MPAKILVVDDEQSILFAMRDYFTAYGYEVSCAREIEEAKSLLSGERFSVVIADLRLSGLNGAEGLEVVDFARKQSPDTNLIILTAYGDPELEREAQRIGVSAFLRKPTPLSQIAQIIFGLLTPKPQVAVQGMNSRP